MTETITTNENNPVMQTTNLDKKRAEAFLKQGKKLRHEYYSDTEWVRLVNSTLITEDGYPKGGLKGEWWTEIQKWDWGWSVID